MSGREIQDLARPFKVSKPTRASTMVKLATKVVLPAADFTHSQDDPVRFGMFYRPVGISSRINIRSLARKHHSIT
jgi:hypothetical protein